MREKTLLSAIKAYSLLPEKYQLPFKVIGNGGQYLQDVKNRIHSKGLMHKFDFIGSIDNTTLCQYYDHCFCLVFPSLYEGFGIPVIEALFVKKPVITSTVSSLPEAAGPGGLLVNPTSLEEIKQAMIAIHDEATYNKLSHDGYHYVAKNFNYQKIAQDYMVMYEGV